VKEDVKKFTTQMVSDDLKTNILTGGFLRGTYAPPDGFCFDALCGNEPIVDNPAFEVDQRDRSGTIKYRRLTPR
jgi:hypothetical protein